MIDISIARKKAQDLLQGLSPKLQYHSYRHTCSVAESILEIAVNEGIENQNDLVILETAAWFHDSGFLHTYHEHEIASCAIVKDYLPQIAATDKEIEKICQLIMATRIPQQPLDLFGFIICDSDLDYLGRPNFMATAELLKKEWLAYGLIDGDEAFFQSEIQFLTQHRYFTQFSQQNREPAKRMHLKELLLAYRQKLTA